MPPKTKARPVQPGAAKSKPREAGYGAGLAERDLAFLIVGGLALVEGIALILLARRKP